MRKDAAVDHANLVITLITAGAVVMAVSTGVRAPTPRTVVLLCGWGLVLVGVVIHLTWLGV